MANLLARLAKALDEPSVEQVPDGWLTARQLCETEGKSQARVSELLRRAVAAGLVEVRTFRIRAGGKVYPVPHYREVTCAKPTARKR